MKWITAPDLERWANTLNSETELAELVKDLIRASVIDIRAFRFPIGDSAQVPGWDGRLSSLGAPPYVPEGDSVWEFGTGKDYVGKANGDYRTRSKDPQGVNPGPTTFVFVTPRRWVRKRINIEKWANEKRAEKLWKDVRVVDGIMLEDWLDQCPVAGSSR